MSGGSLRDHPQAFVKLVTTVIRLIDLSGAATIDAIHRELPYSGYRRDEVVECMDAMVAAGVLLTSNSGAIYVPGDGYPRRVDE